MKEPQPFKALLLDDADVLVAIETLADEAALTDRHVDLRPYGGECDRNPGEYRWDREKSALIPLPRFKRVPAEGVPSLEQLVYAFITGGKSAPAVKVWVAHYEASGGKRPAVKRRK